MKQDIAIDFYRQLSLLLTARLPLPESIRQLSSAMTDRRFKAVGADIAASVEGGEKLSLAMTRYPKIFPEQYVELIRMGETNGTLPETLEEIGNNALADKQISILFSGTVFYPAIVIFAALALFTALMCLIVYPVSKLLVDIEAMDSVAVMVFTLSRMMNGNWQYIVVFLVAVLLYMIFLFSDNMAAQRQLLGFLSRTPLAKSVFTQLMSARICQLWALLLTRGVPESEIFSLISDSLPMKKYSDAMRRIREKLQNGVSLPQAVAECPLLPEAVKLNFRCVPEKMQAKELKNIATLIRIQASSDLNRLAVFWEIGASIFTAMCCALIIVIMFKPLLALYKYMF